MQRKLCIKDFQEKIRMHKPGVKLHPVRLEEFSNLDLSEVVTGLKKFQEINTRDDLRGVKNIKLNGWNLLKIPKPILKLTHLETLSLQHNQIKAVPDEISNLGSLKILNLSFNSFAEVPTPLLHLKSLEYLDIYCNSLTVIPDSIKEMTSIKEMDFRYNSISTIPISINELPLLKCVDFGNNLIKNFPDLFKSGKFKYNPSTGTILRT